MPHFNSWDALTPTHGPLQEPRSGRVVIEAITATGRRPVDRGDLVARQTFVCTVRSDRDGQLRVWQLLRHHIVPER